MYHLIRLFVEEERRRKRIFYRIIEFPGLRSRNLNGTMNAELLFEYYKHVFFPGDNKVQEETRNGDVVEGSYSLIEPDGARRLVSYAADPINGFNAVVQRDPSFTAAAAATVHPIVTPVAVAVRPQVGIIRLL